MARSSSSISPRTASCRRRGFCASRGGRVTGLVFLAALVLACGTGRGAQTPSLLRIRLGQPPLALAAGHRSVWVTSPGSRFGLATRVDARTGAVDNSAHVGWLPESVAVGAGSVWIVNGPKPEARGPSLLQNSLFRLEARTRRTLARIPLVNPESVASGAGAIWVATPEGRVDRVDPRRNRVAARIRVRGRGPSKIAFGFGSVWVLTPLVRPGRASGTLLSRIDPGENRVVDVTHLAGPTGEVAAGEGAIWVSANRVVAIDPRSGRPVGRPIPLIAGNLATGARAVWAAGANGRLFRIDPRTHTVRGKPIRVGASADRVAVAGGFVWVTDSVRSTLVRVRP
jgi:hypothetical protein